jgi:chorismate mutase
MEILEKFKNRAANAQLSEEFISRMIKTIHDESIEIQENVMNQ